MTVTLRLIGSAHADVGLFRMPCGQFTPENIRAQLASLTPFGHEPIEWNRSDLINVKGRATACWHQNHPEAPDYPTSLPAQVDTWIAPFAALVEQAEPAREAARQKSETEQQLAQQATEERNRVEQENTDKRYAKQADDYASKHDAKRLLLGYVANNSLSSAIQAEFGKNDNFITEPDEFSWVVGGHTSGTGAHCLLAIGMASERQLPGPYGLGQPRIALDPAGALLVSWVKRTGTYILLLTKAGWNIPKNTSVQLEVIVAQPKVELSSIM